MFGLVWDYLSENLFRQEEAFTLTFLSLFFVFLYQYATFVEGSVYDDQNWVSQDTLKMFVYMSGLLAIVAHLMPKKKSGETKEGVVRNFNRLNDYLRESLNTAIKIDEQKRLDYIKRKPTIQGGSRSSTFAAKKTLIGERERPEVMTAKEWNPIMKKETLNTPIFKR